MSARLVLVVVSTAAVLLGVPGAAAAATKPGVTSGAASNVAQLSARVAGTVDPNGAATNYYVQYGTTNAYGATTPEVTVTGDGNKSVSVDLIGLTAATKYHYRFVARNSLGQVTGANRTFTTLKEPLAISLSGSPNPVSFGGSTTIVGQVTGTGNGGVTVALQSNPFPYTQGFQQVGNAIVADLTGKFSLPVLSVPFATQYRAVQVGKSVTSPVLTVGVSSRISTSVSATRVRRGRYVRFFGTLKPALPGTLMVVQRKNSKGAWQLAGTMVATGTTSDARYSRRIRVYSAHTYRVYAAVADGKFLPSAGREVKIRIRSN